DPERAYSDSFRLTRSRPNQISSSFTLFRNQQISGQESPFFTIPGSFLEKTRIQGQKQDLFQPKAKRVRPSGPEPVGLGERSTQEPEIVVLSSKISSPINRNITPTQIEHNVVTPEKQQGSHERMKTLTASMENIFKTLQEGHAQLRKIFDKTNKRLNKVFEEQHHSKMDRACLDQEIKKLFNVYHNMKPQPRHVMDNSYHQEDIKPDAIFVNKARSSYEYQDADNMSYSEREALKQLTKASHWPKLSGTGEYDHMELIHCIDGIFIDVPSIPDYWITARLNTAFKGHESQTPDTNARRTEHAFKCRCNHNCALDDIANTLQDITKRKNIGKYSPYKSSGFREKKPFRVEFEDKPRERVAEVTKEKNSSHNCGSTEHNANSCPKAKKKVYAIEKVPEEESPTDNSD
ncbi:hypothetical protein O181_106873, partial [Austropuccinia psidii MF-1]|nr:hypothetical protein [Austropuccinia psidii MF-1]